MLRRLVESVEAEAEAEGFGVARWYSEQLEIVLREQKNFEGEAAVLERYAEVSHSLRASVNELLERLPQAHSKLEKSQSK